MENQKHLFQLDPDVHYLNCARMSPLLKSVEEKGMQGILMKRNPFVIKTDDFFAEAEEIRTRFAKLVNCRPSQVALIPAASYGLGSAIRNVPYAPGKHAISISNEFPSDIFPLQRWCQQHRAELKIIAPDEGRSIVGEHWNEKILSSITSDTAMVVLSSIHWMNGIRFKLKQIGARCREVGARLIVDGTQSVGALPIDVQDENIDALVCASYKCLMGPYSIGAAFFGEAFNEGIPLEESWLNRTNAADFRRLTSYDPRYKPDAGRYNVGESANFILVPMLNEALRQLLVWGPEQVQAYCRKLMLPLVEFCKSLNLPVEPDPYQAYHLMGLRMPDILDFEGLIETLEKQKVMISVRGDTIRVSPSVYNTSEDIDALMNVIKQSLRANHLAR